MSEIAPLCGGVGIGRRGQSTQDGPLCHRPKIYRMVLACEGPPPDAGAVGMTGLRKFCGGKAALSRQGAVLPPEHRANAPDGECALSGGGALSRGSTNISTSCSLLPVTISENSSKGDTAAIPISCLMQIPSLLVGNDTESLGAVERNSDEEEQTQIHNRPVHGL